jgi:hypothetical protein
MPTFTSLILHRTPGTFSSLHNHPSAHLALPLESSTSSPGRGGCSAGTGRIETGSPHRSSFIDKPGCHQNSQHELRHQQPQYLLRPELHEHPDYGRQRKPMMVQIDALTDSNFLILNMDSIASILIFSFLF